MARKPWEVLNDAALNMQRRGRIRGHYASPEGVCILGSIGEVAQSDEERWVAIGEMQRYLDAQPKRGVERTKGRGVPGWNDSTLSDGKVLGAMFSAAREARWREELGDQAAGRAAEVQAFRDKRGGAVAIFGGKRREQAPPESVITPAMRAAWASEADRMERERRDEVINDTDRATTEFDWGGVIREEVSRDEENQRRTREYLEANPLGVSTGPG